MRMRPSARCVCACVWGVGLWGICPVQGCCKNQMRVCVGGGGRGGGACRCVIVCVGAGKFMCVRLYVGNVVSLGDLVCNYVCIYVQALVQSVCYKYIFFTSSLFDWWRLNWSFSVICLLRFTQYACNNTRNTHSQTTCTRTMLTHLCRHAYTSTLIQKCNTYVHARTHTYTHTHMHTRRSRH